MSCTESVEHLSLLIIEFDNIKNIVCIMISYILSVTLFMQTVDCDLLKFRKRDFPRTNFDRVCMYASL